MSVFSPVMLPDMAGQKQNLLAHLMQQHQQAAMRFAGQRLGLGLNDPGRAVAPLNQPMFSPQSVQQKQTQFPPALFGPTVARLRSAGG